MSLWADAKIKELMASVSALAVRVEELEKRKPVETPDFRPELDKLKGEIQGLKMRMGKRAD